jgi:hypothetical protein
MEVASRSRFRMVLSNVIVAKLPVAFGELFQGGRRGGELGREEGRGASEYNAE